MKSLADWLFGMIPILYLGLLSVISLYGFHKVFTVWRFYQHRADLVKPLYTFETDELPKVTVQLPIFNEMYVVERLLGAIAQFNYPPEKLQIQVLDDSTDETQQICQQQVRKLQQNGFNIDYLHRTNRQGFKAGALAQGLKQATGELVMILDADFIPSASILLQMVDYFSDPAVGMVQGRWTHINRRYSLLTQVQALMLDGHFVIEQMARNRSGCFFNFNGTAGIWRVRAIEAAGGWQHTTVTEDLDLSYRAQLQGWQCVYLPHVVVPAELPMEMNSFKSQQFRWAKGASQVAKKLLARVFRAKLPLHVKVEALLHLTNNFSYLLLLALVLLSLPYQIYVAQHSWPYNFLIYFPIFVCTTLNLVGFYWVSQRAQAGPLSGWQLSGQLVLLMSVGVGLSLNQSLAVCDGLIRTGTEFIRTPKHGIIQNSEIWTNKKYRGAKTWVLCLEVMMLLYLLVTILFALYYTHYLSLPFLLMFLAGYGYVFVLGLFQRR
ncbi:MAG: glycosyltransferase [Phormidesmis sp. RL_2_1]|nr:glycosyltransferase [Phormidesmis sp. RL_2_1]